MDAMRRAPGCWFVAVILVAFQPLVSSQGVDAGPQLVFSAKPTRESFYQGEKVSFTFELRNEDSKDVLVSPALILGYDITLNIEDSSGNTVPWCGVIAQWARAGKKLVVLRPGKRLAITRQISCDDQKQEGYSLLEPSNYSAIAKYSLPVLSDGETSDFKENVVAKGPYFAKSKFTIAAPSRAK